MSSQETHDVTDHRRHLENFILVWLHTACDGQEPHIQDYFQQFVTIVDIFTERDSCIDFISDITDASIVFIMNETDHFIASILNDFPQVKYIYLLSTPETPESNDTYRNDRMKTRGIFHDIKAIVTQFKQDTKHDEHNLIAFDIAPVQSTSIQNISNAQEASFMYAQLLKGILINMDDDDMNGMIQFCRAQNTHNKIGLDLIDRFEKEYQPNRAIWWYSLDSFLYRMLNRALHIQDIDVLYHYRTFIRDIHRTISQLHVAAVERNDRIPIALYRGQLIPSDDFEKVRTNIGGLLSIKRFLSTSENRDLALIFAGESDSNVAAVLLEILLNSTHTSSSVPFASIETFSQFGSSEQEYLFSMGTVFRIDRVEDIGNNRFCVQLTLTQDNDPQLTALTKQMAIQLHARYDLTTLGMLMLETGDYQRAKTFFSTSLATAKMPSYRARCHDLLGIAYEKLGDYNNAMKQFKLELKLHRQILPPNHFAFAPLYSNIAVIYMDLGQLDLALKYFQKALTIGKTASEPNIAELSVYHNHIGLILKAKGRLEESLAHQKEVVRLRQICLSPIHPDIAQAYNNLAMAYHELHRDDEAMSMHKKSMEIVQKSLPPNHITFAVGHSNVGAILYSQGKFNEALNHFKESLRIKLKSLAPLHPDMAVTYSNLAETYYVVESYDNALEMYERTVELYRTSFVKGLTEKLVNSTSGLIRCLVKLGRTSDADVRIRDHYKWSIEVLKCTNEEAQTLQNLLEKILSSISLDETYSDLKEL